MKTRLSLAGLTISILTLLLLGCQSGSQQTTSSETAKSSDTASAASSEAAPKPEKVSVPAGTALTIRLTDGIDTGKTAAGSAFEGTLASGLVVGDQEVAAIGSTVTGKVTDVVSSGRLNRPARLSLVLTSLTPRGGEKTQISTHAWSMKGQSHKKRDIEAIGGGGGAGALIGALTGGKKGAAIGAAVGAGAGTGVAAATGKKEIHLAPETKLTFRLSAPITLPSIKKAA